MIRQNFNSDWTLMNDKKSSLGTMTKRCKTIPVQIPHDAMIHEERTPETENQSQTGFYPGGQYVYIKKFYAEKEWEEKTVIIEFEGIYQTAMVYLNGHLVAHNLYGYSNFYAVLDSNLLYGEINELKVIANNSAVSNSRWYSGFVTGAIEESVMASDVTGLNYLTGRHVLERKLHPNKTVIGAETYPADVVRLWKIVKENSHVLGDYTWAGHDYLGEAGCGIFHYDGTANFSNVYPERTAYIGDLDLIGYRRPISYLREIVFGFRKQPYIAVERLNRYGMKSSKTAWMFKDNVESWTWPGYEGKPAVVDVYADAEEVELFINGKSVGKKPAGEEHSYTATYELLYAPGELEAVAYNDSKEIGRYKIRTASSDIKIVAVTDTNVLKAGGEDLAFITISLSDQEGNCNMYEQKLLHIDVKGEGVLQGFGNANPCSLESYDSNECNTYDGYAMAVVRAGQSQGKIQIIISAEACEDKVIELLVN